MGLRLEQVVPWGRSLGEYVRMFNLTDNDLRCKILDCGGGPASFNAENTRRGNSVISCDPLYQFSATEIQQRIDATYPIIVQKVEAAKDNFLWTTFQSPEQMAQTRKLAMQQFLDDFPKGLQATRYQAHALPELPFPDKQFAFALCSHLLFTYSEHFSYEFHLASVLEMCRVATEVRIFPLLVNMTGERSPFVEPLMAALTEQGYAPHIRRVAYEFQQGGNELLQILQT
jgi:hypothetical protein